MEVFISSEGYVIKKKFENVDRGKNAQYIRTANTVRTYLTYQQWETGDEEVKIKNKNQEQL